MTDPDRILDTDGEDSEERHEAPLQQLVMRGLGWSFLSTVLTRIIGLGAGILMARLLTPEDFGIYSVGAITLTIAAYINDVGIEPLIVRWPGRIDKVAPTAMTLVGLTSATLFVAVFLAAPWIASSLGSPDGTGIVRIMAIALLISGIFTVNSAQVNRDFRQKARTKAEVCGLIATNGLGVLLAFFGLGPYSLAVGQVAGTLVTSLGLFFAVRHRYRPGLNSVAARELLQLGLPLAASGLMAAAALNLDFIVVGHGLGSVSLGLYLLAWNVASWPVNGLIGVIQHVSVAGFSKLQHDIAGLERALSSSLRASLLATGLMCGLLAGLADPLVGSLYGKQWEGSAGPLALLAALGFIRCATTLMSDLLIAVGRIRATFVIRATWFLAMLVALPIGARIWGVNGVAAGQLVVAIVVVLPVFGLALIRHGIAIRRITIAAAWPAVAAVLAFVCTRLSSGIPTTLIWQLVLGGCVGTLSYACLTWPTWYPALHRRYQRRSRA